MLIYDFEKWELNMKTPPLLSAMINRSTRILYSWSLLLLVLFLTFWWYAESSYKMMRVEWVSLVSSSSELCSAWRVLISWNHKNKTKMNNFNSSETNHGTTQPRSDKSRNNSAGLSRTFLLKTSCWTCKAHKMKEKQKMSFPRYKKTKKNFPSDEEIYSNEI